jgi:hypothetical protein
MERISVKPFIKWAGGKGQLLKEIKKLYPFENKKIDKYAEPFIGGGAVLFDILTNYDIKKAYISDVNKELINIYKVIQNKAEELITFLKKFEEDYLPLENEERKEYYLQKREEYNNWKKRYNAENIEEMGAALFIFLNKTCFNGLYRVNKKGEFNVPMGAYKKPLICDEENLRNISILLKNVEIICADYTKSENFIDENTLVYFDPPYRPLTETASFTSYTEFSFNDEEQIRLAEFIKTLNSKNIKAILSNSDPKNVNQDDNFFDDLYKGFNIRRIGASRMINSKGSSRGKITELLINNF